MRGEEAQAVMKALATQKQNEAMYVRLMASVEREFFLLCSIIFFVAGVKVLSWFFT